MAVLPNPMPDDAMVSPVERLTADRFETLQLMTQANGYPFTLNPSRTARGNAKPDHLSAYLTAGSAYRADLNDNGQEDNDTFMHLIQPHLVEVYYRVGEADATPIDQLLTMLSAWVQTAWMADCSCGGLSEGTWFARHTLQPFNDPPGVAITFHTSLFIDSRVPLASPA